MKIELKISKKTTTTKTQHNTTQNKTKKLSFPLMISSFSKAWFVFSF